LAYITREVESDLELLVFRHVHFPEAGVQVPGGTVDPDEEPEAAVWREVMEESGLFLLDSVRLLFKGVLEAEPAVPVRELSVFHAPGPPGTAEG
jgi:8-oxo-dGTP pyrophosphatase MutT (NUDIX family)